MTKITFVQYLESKDTLREAVNKTPKQVSSYTIRKYCKLPIGESKEEKELIPLKPKQRIFVEWLYEDIKNPIPLKINFSEDVKGTSPDDEFDTFWKGDKLLKWLLRNAREESKTP